MAKKKSKAKKRPAAKAKRAVVKAKAKKKVGAAKKLPSKAKKVAKKASKKTKAKAAPVAKKVVKKVAKKKAKKPKTVAPVSPPPVVSTPEPVETGAIDEAPMVSNVETEA